MFSQTCVCLSRGEYLGRYPPGRHTPPGHSACWDTVNKRRYASNWNAFLFYSFFLEDLRKNTAITVLPPDANISLYFHCRRWEFFSTCSHSSFLVLVDFSLCYTCYLPTTTTWLSFTIYGISWIAPYPREVVALWKACAAGGYGDGTGIISP